MDKLSLLKSVFIFSELDDALLRQVVSLTKEVNFKANTDIFREGDKSDSFYIVNEGEITIFKQLGPGREKALAVLGKGLVFGEMAFFSDFPINCGISTVGSPLLTNT